MRPHPRIRKTIKWGGAAVTVLLVVVWIGSGWYRVTWGNSNGFGCAIDVWHGRAQVLIGRANPFARNTFNVGLIEERWRVSRLGVPVSWATDKGPSWYRVRLDVPLWLPSTVAFLAIGLAWHLDTLARRRALLNLCPKCNYDRAGLGAGAVCPECGDIPKIV